MLLKMATTEELLALCSAPGNDHHYLPLDDLPPGSVVALATNIEFFYNNYIFQLVNPLKHIVAMWRREQRGRALAGYRGLRVVGNNPLEMWKVVKLDHVEDRCSYTTSPVIRITVVLIPEKRIIQPLVA